MAQQLPVAFVLYWLGGVGFVLWAVSLRVSVSLIMHWMIGHFAHRKRKQNWVISGLPVQGYNVPYASILSFGENWHDNHHAFPHSAKLGIEPRQLDLGFAFILMLERLGFAWNVQLPDYQKPREGLVKLRPESNS